MSTAQGMAIPRAPRGKQQPSQSTNGQVQQSNNGKQSQRRPKGNRTHTGNSQQNSAGVSPSRPPLVPDPTLAESAVFSSEGAQPPTGPPVPKKHTQSQPSIDRGMFVPGANTSPMALPATPARNQGAYAGPTFHASPAPSALPIPKFLSRSVPPKSRPVPSTPPPEDSSESVSSSPEASPSRAPSSAPQRHVDTPLDMLFKADRAEREKRAKYRDGKLSSPNLFNPTTPARPQPHKHDSFNAPFPIELDGENQNEQHMSSPPIASPIALRSRTDPAKVPQLKDISQSPNNDDIMRALFSKLSASQKKPTTSPAIIPSGPGLNHGRAGANRAPAPAKKPPTSMMAFVPASVAAKKYASSQIPPSTGATPPPKKASPPRDTLALEQDLKRMLNITMNGDVPGAR
jgi:hypothetical protein